MNSLPDVINKYNSDPQFKVSFNKVVFDYLSEINPEMSKSEQLKDFVSNKDRKRFVIKAANMIDKIDHDLSDEMIDMDLDSIKSKLKAADKKFVEPKPEISPVGLNKNVVRAESVEQCNESIVQEIKAALDESQNNLVKNVRQRLGENADFNDYQKNRDIFEKHNLGRSAFRGFEAEAFGNVDSVREEFENRMEAARAKNSGYNYDNGIAFEFDTEDAEKMLSERIPEKAPTQNTRRSNSLKRGW